MASALRKGLYQKTRGGSWMVRRRVPDDLRSRFGHEFKASMKTDDVDLAQARAERWWADRDRDIELARHSSEDAVAKVETVLQALETWRAQACLRAAGAADYNWPEVDVSDPGSVLSFRASVAYRRPAEMDTMRASLQLMSARLSANAYFAEHPQASRSASFPAETAWLLERLDAVARTPDDWRHVEGFDARLDDALVAGGLRALVLPQVREQVRTRFAAAWAEVVRHEELERRRHAAVLAAVSTAMLTPADIQPPSSRPAYVPRLGDKTLKDVIEAVRREKARGKSKEAGEAYVRKNYEHVFRALVEMVGEATPMRAITREDVREVRSLLERLPPNASKIYPDLTLIEAADRAEAEGREPMSHNNARSYMVNLSALCNFAVEERWLNSNPCKGLVPGRLDSVRRRGFDAQELACIFERLEQERYSDRWWVITILAFSGARASEVCQLLTEDVKTYEDLPYLDFTCFDAAGRRTQTKKLKTQHSSDRAAPLHPQLIEAGFLDFVEARRDAGEARLFPSLRRHALNGYSGDLSKWFARHLDAVGLSQPSLVLHSFRHGFREAGKRINLVDEVIDVLGGWAPKTVGAKYGGRAAVPDNTAHMSRIELGGFRLANGRWRADARTDAL